MDRRLCALLLVQTRESLATASALLRVQMARLAPVSPEKCPHSDASALGATR